MGGGKGKIKTLNAKRTTYFLKHAKMKNRPAFFAKSTDIDAKQTITDTNQQSCTELTLYVGGVQRGIRSRSLEKTYTEENVSKLFMKEVLFINFEIIIIF